MVTFRHGLLACFVTMHVILAVRSAATVDPSECRRLMDLYIVIDGSDSISYPDFETLKATITSFLPVLDYGPQKARLGMLVYSTGVPATSEHTFSTNLHYLQNAARTLEHPREGTNTGLGIEHMRQKFIVDGRPNVPWVCIVITDGISKNATKTALESKLAEKMGISMFAVGIGSLIDMNELQTIASTPKQALQLQNFEQLAGMLASMTAVICPCPVPMTLPLAKCNDGPRAIGTTRQYQCLDGYLQVGNPYITCRDDFTWTPLDPGFACVQCGDTPVIANGFCGGGEYLLGSIRHYQCEPGYRAVGKSEIRCLEDATWSLPDFKCIPCGDTPVIENGFCDGNEYTIGAIRHYKCNPGYKAVGTSDIRCLNDATWSPVNFQCIPCGATPVIDNGICGSGEYTLGSIRKFECLPGYLGVGHDQIKCLDDATWSVPDFKCIPCGDTPLLDHATCDGGDYTIGSVRRYSCLKGYLGVGDPTIRCRETAQWTLPDYKCTACGEPPVIPNGECGGGEFLIGTQRQYQCYEGYMAMGSPVIECLNDATWSKPSIQCLDCGAPPMVANAFTNLGPSLIGTTREYFCNTGYQMVGLGMIRCLGTGQWEKPTFSCTLKTTTTTTTPAPVPSNPSVCDACRLINGVGYNSHPFDCNQYIQCFIGTKGMEPVYRRCPFGQFWDQNVLTCLPSHQVNCPHDKCASGLIGGYKATDPNNCCSYWKCEGGKAYGDCCGEGRSFNARLGYCVEDDTCERDCPDDYELPACDKRPDMTDVTIYHQHIGNNYWVPMPCAPGTAFNPVDCMCSLVLMTLPGSTRQQVCKPEVYLPFTGSFNDRSGKNVYILPENVTLHDNAAFFNGRSRILINRFSNTEFHGHLVIKFRYKELLEGPTAYTLQALVTNGDCGSDPSVVIAKMPGYVLCGAKTNQARSFALPTLDKEWKEVIYIHDEKRLESRVCGASMSKWSYGPIQATHCAMQIGYGNGLQSFMGLIDDFYVFQCRPRDDILNINY